MKYSYAFTAPINPPSATPKLTRAQVWEGLVHKARDPIKYVPGMATCEVLEENADGLTRQISLKPGSGPPGKVTEKVVFKKEVRADFEMVDLGNTISNIISDGEGESDLYLTFTFNLNFPDIQEGTQEATERAERMQGTAETAVGMTINQIRSTVKEQAGKV
ncbi:hypothetical protein BDY19DRAFT_988233 [Irpex rosettiformis]|uniref:Uncharacterized protein n=1 Tax=Irpex rosettiformis TaxID=378272 RepID=A0ACB8UJU0_9APHY|nr:hypothetical protein BDY19DRAFT_988233 [Irpex rosettiformis]